MRGTTVRLPLLATAVLLGVAVLVVAFVLLRLLSIGWFLLQQGDRRGARMLRQAYQDGDQYAGHLLGGHLKRAGEWRDAVIVWQDLVRTHDSLDAAVELSKYYEHRTRDLGAALTWIVPFLTRDVAGDDLLHREARIRAKLRRATAD